MSQILCALIIFCCCCSCWILIVITVIISFAVLLVRCCCCFFLENACDGFEPYNERVNGTSKHLTKQMHTPSNSKEKERKNEMKTLLSAYLVARVRFTQRNCFGSYDVWGLFLARSSPVARFIKHSTFKLCASVSVCVSKSNFSFGYYESQTFFSEHTYILFVRSMCAVHFFSFSPVFTGFSTMPSAATVC